ncbi:glycoside hydrolase family 16 protein [Litoribaculum gwangyangense]|uniref:Glycoside hydrolase family 16 protein n=1 Tax=Litoribaculum gwangyangense TaxID=1130722 RepID=A0ABP9CIJ5_9FLAO
MNFINKFKTETYKLLYILTLSVVVFSCETDDTQTVTTFNKLVMADEFDTDGSPNSGLWTNWIGTAFNNELQYYTDRPENIKVEDGMLHITARKENFNGSQYTSARIETKGLFAQRYGRFEARIKLPWGKGFWPAFWLLGNNIDEVTWPFCGEIDIMENRGQEPTIVHGSVHGPGYSASKAITKTYDLQNDRLDTDFHVYGIEWGENYINYYIDDVLYNQITPDDLPTTPLPEEACDELTAQECFSLNRTWNQWVFDQPFYIIINLAVGGDFPGSPNAETIFPQTMLVDYVRVYTK